MSGRLERLKDSLASYFLGKPLAKNVDAFIFVPENKEPRLTGDAIEKYRNDPCIFFDELYPYVERALGSHHLYPLSLKMGILITQIYPRETEWIKRSNLIDFIIDNPQGETFILAHTPEPDDLIFNNPQVEEEGKTFILAHAFEPDDLKRMIESLASSYLGQEQSPVSQENIPKIQLLVTALGRRFSDEKKGWRHPEQPFDGQKFWEDNRNFLTRLYGISQETDLQVAGLIMRAAPDDRVDGLDTKKLTKTLYLVMAHPDDQLAQKAVETLAEKINSELRDVNQNGSLSPNTSNILLDLIKITPFDKSHERLWQRLRSFFALIDRERFEQSKFSYQLPLKLRKKIIDNINNINNNYHITSNSEGSLSLAYACEALASLLSEKSTNAGFNRLLAILSNLNKYEPSIKILIRFLVNISANEDISFETKKSFYSFLGLLLSKEKPQE